MSVLSSSILQPRIVAQAELTEVDVFVVPPETMEVTEVVVEQMDALLVSQGSSGLDLKVGTWSLPILQV